MSSKKKFTHCTEFVSQVWLYLDNGLPESVREKWEAHLTSCKRCSQELAEAKELLTTYQRLPDYDIDDLAFEAAVQQAIKPLEKQARILWRRKFIYWGAPLAAAAALLLFIFLSERQQENNLDWQTTNIEYKLFLLEDDIDRVASDDLELVSFNDDEFTDSMWDVDLQYIEGQINSLAFELASNF